MSFKDLDIKISYASYGSDNIVDSFLVPALKQTKTYRRSVGFFSSSVFGPIIDGIVALSRNRGKIQLIEMFEGQHLSDDDYFQKHLKAHLDRGARMIYSEFKYNNDFLLAMMNTKIGL